MLRSLAAIFATALVALFPPAASAQTAGPDAAMMAAPQKLARFLETADERDLQGVFSGGEVTIIENFAPHVFEGQAGLADWRGRMVAHVKDIRGLKHKFGAPQDFRRTGDTVFLTLPTRWTGVQGGKTFTEHGGWSFVLVRDGEAWRIRAYGWAVVSFAG